jgi:hypothetical protein
MPCKVVVIQYFVAEVMMVILRENLLTLFKAEEKSSEEILAVDETPATTEASAPVRNFFLNGSPYSPHSQRKLLTQADRGEIRG